MYESETSHGNLHLSVVQCIKHELNKNFTQEKVDGSTCFELYTMMFNRYNNMLRHIIYTILYIMTRHNLYKLFIKPFTVWPKESCQTFSSKIDRNWSKSYCKTSWWRQYFFHGKLTNIKWKITVALMITILPRWVDTNVGPKLVRNSYARSSPNPLSESDIVTFFSIKIMSESKFVSRIII